MVATDSEANLDYLRSLGAVPVADGPWLARRIGLRGTHLINLWLGGLGLLSIALGVFLLAFPRAGILSLVWLIASYTAILGILYIVIGVRLRALQRAPGVD